MPMVNGKFNINPAQAKMSAPVADPAADPSMDAADTQQILISKNPDGTFSAGDPADPEGHESFASCDEALAAAKTSLDGSEPDGDEQPAVTDQDNGAPSKDSAY